MKSAWKVLKTRLLFKNQWFDVREESLLTPHGQTLDGILVHEFPDWVNVIALTPERKVILERQYRHGMGIFTRETPSGSLEKSDLGPEAGAHRELREETGFVAGSVILLGKSQANPHLMNNWIFHFLMLDCVQHTGHHSESDVQWYLEDFEQALAQVRNGAISHSYTVEGLLRAWDYLGSLPA